MDRRDFVKVSGVMAAGMVTGQSSPDAGAPRDNRITVFLCGDVMTGRGLDQVMPHPSDPVLHERYVKSAEAYVRLAEQANGPIPQPVTFSYPWGDALAELARVDPDKRIINLETSVTTSSDPWDKGIHYRMHPDNVGCLTAAGVDCCVLANNHVLDWGRRGLSETLDTLRGAGIAMTGAGKDAREAAAPAVLDVPGKGRVLVFSFGTSTSGIPSAWAATVDRNGVNFLPDLSGGTVRRIVRQIEAVRQPSDVVIASIHWGPNWGYDVPRRRRRFAHALVDDAGVDVVHGHSSHHPKAIEMYRGRPILYGCGDFLTDYEGISGYEEYRDDLAFMYFVSVDPSGSRPASLRMTPLQMRRFSLHHADDEDVDWLAGVLQRECAKFDTTVEAGPDNRFEVFG